MHDLANGYRLTLAMDCTRLTKLRSKIFKRGNLRTAYRQPVVEFNRYCIISVRCVGVVNSSSSWPSERPKVKWVVARVLDSCL